MKSSLIFAVIALASFSTLNLVAQAAPTPDPSANAAAGAAATTAPTTTTTTTTTPTTTTTTTTTTIEPSPAASVVEPPSGVPTVAASELAEASERIAILNGQIAAMTSDLDAAEERLTAKAKELEDKKAARAADAEAASRLQGDLFAAIDTAKAETEDLSARLAERDGIADRLAVLESEKADLLAKLGSARVGTIDLADWPTVLVSGFLEAKPRIGKWQLSLTSAEQTNDREFFSRLDMPLEQRDKPFLYRFTTTTSGKGWVGLGLHFFASDVKSKRGYGEGRSLLLWFTRDPAVRRTNATWLQLYRSDTDVIMERVLDAKMEESMGDPLAVDTIYDPDSGLISVSVNGRLAVRYRAWFGIEQGVGVSLRTLGAGGKFSDFEIRTTQR